MKNGGKELRWWQFGAKVRAREDAEVNELTEKIRLKVADLERTSSLECCFVCKHGIHGETYYWPSLEVYFRGPVFAYKMVYCHRFPNTEKKDNREWCAEFIAIDSPSSPTTQGAK